MSESQELALPDDYETGLEEFDQSDLVMPRLNIVHADGKFQDSLSGQQFNPITVIFLGLVKQRVLWHFKVDDNDLPMCKSFDFEIGFPRFDDSVRPEKRFPWDKSGFDPANFNLEDTVELPCKGCRLKDWKSHPDGVKPYCSEQFVLPSLYDPFDNNKWVPVILQFQRTQMGPAKGYLSSFVRSDEPLFTAKTEITLRGAKRGSNEYSIPNFVNVGVTERGEDGKNWKEYSQLFTQIKKFLRTMPLIDDGTIQPEPSENVNTGPMDTTDSQAESVVPTSTPQETPPADDEDLPF